MIGEVLGSRYTVRRKLDEGGMGAVYEAQHMGTGRRVAVKVITSRLAQDDAIMARFEREARAAGAIESEHIAQILDCGKDPATGLPFIVMEFLSGEDVGRLLAKVGPLHPDLALRIMAQACLGLHKAHNAKVMHRDIKPANLFLARRDGEIVVKLLDFGVAKIKMEDTLAAGAELTRTSALIGSPLYMSPEQARGMKDIDYRTDIWSLGVLLYKMLTGRTPHEDIEALGDLIYSICSSPTPPLQAFAPWVPPEVAAVAHRALRVNRAERFQSASEMLQAIRALLPCGHAIREEMFAPLTGAARAEVAPLLSISEPGTTGEVVPQGPVATWTVPPPPRAGSAPDLSFGKAPETTQERTAGLAVNSLTLSREPLPARTPRSAIALAAAALALLAGVAGSGALLKTSAPTEAAAAPAELAQGVQIDIDPERLASFGPLPTSVTSPENPLSSAKIELGRMLFHEARLSKNHDLSCNSCHPLDRYGTNGEKVPAGHAHQSGRRNAPTVFNAAGYSALLWDGMTDSLEEQATMPLLRSNEMATTETRTLATLRSMPEYVKGFAKAFPDERAPLSLFNVGRAIAAFERRLLTRGRWDAFLEGDNDALTDKEKQGFNAFVETGCVSCHVGPYVGASMFQKVGLVKAWPNTRDRGRFEITRRDADFMVFRVPSLRNVAMTAPYFHDGSTSSLEEAITLMARHQVGKELPVETVDSIATWLRCLTGDLTPDMTEMPALPESGPATPHPEPG